MIFMLVVITIYLFDIIQSHSQQVASLAGPDLDLLHGLTGNVGLYCTAIQVIAVGGNSCNAMPACCSNDKIVSHPKFMSWRSTYISCLEWCYNCRMQSH